MKFYFQGHVVGHAITGGMGGGSQPAAPAPAAPAPAPQQPYDPNTNPCAQQLQQFLDCTQQQSDISLCYGFNEALKQCKLQFGKYVFFFKLAISFNFVSIVLFQFCFIDRKSPMNLKSKCYCFECNIFQR